MPSEQNKFTFHYEAKKKKKNTAKSKIKYVFLRQERQFQREFKDFFRLQSNLLKPDGFGDTVEGRSTCYLCNNLKAASRLRQFSDIIMLCIFL